MVRRRRHQYETFISIGYGPVFTKLDYVLTVSLSLFFCAHP